MLLFWTIFTYVTMLVWNMLLSCLSVSLSQVDVLSELLNISLCRQRLMKPSDAKHLDEIQWDHPQWGRQM